jgi:hypothetical protein
MLRWRREPNLFDKLETFVIEIETLARACGLNEFRYHAFPPIIFDAIPLLNRANETASNQSGAVITRLLEKIPLSAPLPVVPERIPPVFATPLPVASTANQPVPTAALPALPPSVLPAGPSVEDQHALPEPAALWRARLRAASALASYTMLADVAESLDSMALPPVREAEPTILSLPASTPPPRRKARSAGRAAMSAIPPN